jgi:hypothetical protein
MDEDDIDSNVDEEISGHIRAGGAAPSDALLRLMREAADSYDPATKSKLSEPPLILIQRKLAALKQTLRERAGQLELKHQCSVCSSTFTTMRLRVEHQEKQHPEFAIFLAECQKQLPPTLIELLEQFMQTSAQQAAQFAEEIGLAPSQLDALRSTVVPPAPADSPALPRPERAKGMRVGEKPSLRLNNPPPLPKLRPQRSDGDAFQCTKSQGWQNHRWHPSPASSALLPPCMPWPLDLAQAPRQEGGAKPGKCAVCGSSFGWFLWRHNCRGCAAVICANCSHTASLALLGYSAAKVCPTCYDVPPYQLSEEAVRQYVLNNRRRLTPQVFLDLQAARPFPTAVLRELAQHLQDSNVAVSMWMERAGGTLRNEWRNYWILCSSEAQRRDLVALCEFSRVELLEIARVELAAGRKTASWFYGSILADKAAWLHELTWLNEHAQGDVYSAFCRLIPVTFTLADLLPFLVPDRVKFAFDLRLTSPQQLELGRQLFLSASPAFAEWKDLNQASSSESTWIEWVRSECSSQPELALTFLLLVAKPPADLVWTLGLQLYQWKDEEARATWLRYAEDHLKPTDWSTFIAKPAQTLQEVELGVIALSRCSGDVPLDDFVERGRALLSKAPSLFPEWVGCFSKRTTPDWEKYARQFCGTAPHFAFRCLRCCENDSADFWFDWLLQCTKEGFYPVAKQILQSSPLQRTTAADWRTEAQRQLAKSNLAGALFCVAQQTEVSVLDWCLERNQHLLALYVDRKAFLAWTRQQAEAGTDKTPVLMLALESCTGDARLPMLLRCIDHLSQQQKAPSITRELTLFALSLQSSTVQKAKLITQQAKTLSQNSKPLELSALAYAESLLGGHLPDDAEIRRQTLVAEVKAELHQKQIAAAQPLLKLLGSMELTALVEKMLEHYYTDEMDAIYGFVRSLKSFITSKSSNLHRALMFFARGLGKLHELQVDGVRDVANAVYACPAPEIQAAVVSIFTDPLVRSICLLDDIRWLEELPDWNQEVRLSQRHFYAEAFASSKVVRRIVRHERAVASAQASPAERASFFWNVADDTIGPASEAQAYVLAAWQLATALSSEKDNSKFGHKTGMFFCISVNNSRSRLHGELSQGCSASPAAVSPDTSLHWPPAPADLSASASLLS